MAVADAQQRQRSVDRRPHPRRAALAPFGVVGHHRPGTAQDSPADLVKLRQRFAKMRAHNKIFIRLQIKRVNKPARLFANTFNNDGRRHVQLNQSKGQRGGGSHTEWVPRQVSVSVNQSDSKAAACLMIFLPLS